MRSLVDPRLAGVLANSGHYPNTVTIERATLARNSVGELLDADGPEPVAGMVNLAARIERDRGGTTTAELRDAERIGVIDRYAIALAGYFPTIRLTDTAVDDLGRRFEITKVDHEAGGSFTFLRCEVLD